MVPNEPEPARIDDAPAFAVALAELKGTRSYRDLNAASEALTPSAAREASGVADWTPEMLARGTVSDWVAGRGLPSRAKMLTFLVVCGVPAGGVPAWLDVLDRVRRARRADAGAPPDAAAPEAPPAAAPDAGPPTRRPWRRVAVGVALAAVAMVGAGVALTRGGDPGTAAPAVAVPPPCADVADGHAVVASRVTSAGSASGLTFCPVRINDGRLPITGPFALAGQVVGPVAERGRLLLANWADPRTCDALGNAAARGGFLAGQVDLAGADGRWTHVDSLGYDEAVTLGRQYRYILAPPAAAQAIRSDEERWVAAHPTTPDDYPGILTLPADAQVVATFDVPAGIYPDAKPCRG